MATKKIVALAAPATLASIGTIGYVWAGYPLLVGLLARYRPIANVPDPGWTKPTVTVVVAALDEEQVIGEKVTELLTSTYPAELLDVVVVTDGSTDATAEVARRAGGARCRVLESPARAGKPAAVNRGVTAAVGEVVVLSDANNRYEPETVDRLVGPFADPTVGATVGAKRVSGGIDAVAVGDGIYWRYESAIKAAESRSGSCTAASGEVMAVRRSSIVELPPGIVNDDFFLMLGVLRSGSRVVYVPDARSVERSSASVDDERTRRTRMAAGRFDNVASGRSLLPHDHRLQWQIVSHKYLRLALPAAFAGALLGSIVWVAGGGRRWARLILGGQLGFHAVSVLGRRARVGGRLGKALGIPSFLLEANIATVRGFVALAPRHLPRWLGSSVQRADDADEPRRLPAPTQELEVAS